MIILRHPTIALSRFTYRAGTFIAEASDLGLAFKLHRIYDDAYDEGIAIEGPCGGLVRFYLADTTTDEGDVTSWEFRPIAEDARRYPTVVGVTVFND